MARPSPLIVAAALALSSASSLSAAELSSGDQAKLIGSVDGYASRISEVALKIWASPELGYQETKTTALLQAELEERAGAGMQQLVTLANHGRAVRIGQADHPDRHLLAVARIALRLVHQEQLTLSVGDGNAAAYRLYRKMGFSEYGREMKALKDGNRYFDEILMVRFLHLD